MKEFLRFFFFKSYTYIYHTIILQKIFIYIFIFIETRNKRIKYSKKLKLVKTGHIIKVPRQTLKENKLKIMAFKNVEKSQVIHSLHALLIFKSCGIIFIHRVNVRG